MARRGRHCATLLVAIVVLAACAGPGAGREPVISATDLLGEWELIDGLSGNTQLPLPAGARATITFDTDRLGGTSFCNSYSSGYLVSGGSLMLQGLGGTELGCEPTVMSAESAYLRALRAVDSAAVEDGDLLLTGEGSALRFRPVPATPASDLIGTRWVLETLVQGEVASSTLGEPAVLVLVADGALSGSTGCRTLSGRWARTGDTIVFPQLHVDGDCPAGVRSQDEQVLAVLAHETTAAVDADRLTLTGPEGLGLVYRART